MQTKKFYPLEKDEAEYIKIIKEAADIIKAGGLVGFPTETVYGLGANALDEEAAKKIYIAKGRPSDNPMIAHISQMDQLYPIVEDVSEDAKLMADAFWPGPLTMIFNRKPIVPDVTTGGLDTVGIRFPEEKIARDLISMSGVPLAAPSGNLSGKPSPTTFEHVVEDMDGRIDAIIKGLPCKVGIESTVVDMTGEVPVILRPGIITKEMIESVLGKGIEVDKSINQRPEDRKPDEEFRPKAPGMKYRHYAPKAPMTIFEGEKSAIKEAISREFERLSSEGKKVKVILFEEGSEEEAARLLFAKLREADRENVDFILAGGLEERGVGFSVMNRMLKSASFNIHKV